MYDRFDVIVGERVRQARIDANMTQEELASKLGYTKQWLSAKEHGIYKMSFADAIKLADACNVSVESFVGTK